MNSRRASTKRVRTANTNARSRNPKQAKFANVDLRTLSLSEIQSLGSQLIKSAKYTIERGENRQLETSWKWRQIFRKDTAAYKEEGEKTRKIYNREIGKHKSLAITNIKKIKFKIVDWKEIEQLSSFERSLCARISLDPDLAENYVRSFNNNIDKGLMEHIPIKLKRMNQKKNEGRSSLTLDLVEFIQNVKYPCPEIRTLLTHPGGIMGRNEIQVFCDLTSKKKTGFRKEFIYEYLDRNYIDKKKYPELVKFTEKAEKEDNVIKCNCCSEGSTVPCWMNEKCDCYKTNKKLQSFQVKTSDEYPVKAQFHSFKPTIFGGNLDYETTIGFACSELCACKGNCTNNVTTIPEKKIFPFEIFRKDAIVGFAARSMAAIPAGTMIVEYTGELVDGPLLEKGAEIDYAFDLCLNSPATINFLTNVGDWSQRFKNELKSQLLCAWHVDSKMKGNITRFCSHSCFPNCAFIRVFQKGFSPAHCRVFLISLMDIFPGVELTIDYGSTYVEHAFTGGCLCKSVVCKNNPEIFAIFSNLSNEAIKSFFALSHHSEFNRYQEIVKFVS